MIAHPTLLSNSAVELRPLDLADLDGLWAQAGEEEIWRYMRIGFLDSPERLRHWAETAIANRAKGTDYPFVIVDKSSGLIAGSTRYWNVDLGNRSLEIGGSWLGKAFRRTRINTNAKYLLLRHAFESLQFIRVQIRTDVRNERSQRAIERLGAVREGVFRKDFIYPDGYERSTVYYSIIDTEWPAVKQRLEAMLAA